MRAFVFGVLITVAGCAPATDEPVAQAASVSVATPATVATSAPVATSATAATSAPAAVPESAVTPASAASPALVASPTPAPQAAQRAPAQLLTKGGVNYACSVPADCAVKDVGNCCGYYPACVNKDSPTFPDQVKAQCANTGMSSVCGFQDVGGCDCIEGRCTALPGNGAAGDVQKD